MGDCLHQVHPAQVVPPDVSLDDVSHRGLADALEGLVGPLAVADLEFVPPGEGTMLDEQPADIVAGPWRAIEGVKRFVGDGGVSDQASQEVPDVRLADPGQPAIGTLHGLQCRGHGDQLRRDPSGLLAGKELVDVAARTQDQHRPAS